MLQIVTISPVIVSFEYSGMLCHRWAIWSIFIYFKTKSDWKKTQEMKVGRKYIVAELIFYFFYFAQLFGVPNGNKPPKMWKFHSDLWSSMNNYVLQLNPKKLATGIKWAAPIPRRLTSWELGDFLFCRIAWGPDGRCRGMQRQISDSGI